MYFRNYRRRNKCLDKCLNARIWEDPSTGDMVNGPKNWLNLNESAFIVLSDRCEGNWATKLTPRDMKILHTFSQHIDCWWQVFPSSDKYFTSDDKYFLLVETSEWKQFGCIYLKNKTFFLHVFRICRPFLNTVSACDKYSLISRDKWMQKGQMNLSQKQNIFSVFFSGFFESALNLEHYQKNVTLIAYVFPKLPTTKDALR